MEWDAIGPSFSEEPSSQQGNKTSVSPPLGRASKQFASPCSHKPPMLPPLIHSSIQQVPIHARPCPSPALIAGLCALVPGAFCKHLLNINYEVDI